MRNTSLLICGLTAVAGSRPGGKEESRAGEDQKPEEKVQKENPREHSEAETRTTKKKTDQEKTDEKGCTGYSMNTVYCFITGRYLF